MKRFFTFFGAFVFLLLVTGAGLIAYVLTFDPNENKDWLAEKFAAATGRTIAFDGNLSWTLYPWLGVSMENVSIGNAPGFGTEPMLQARNAAFRIKLLPLLDDRIEIDTVILDGAQLLLHVNGKGETNWSDLGGSQAGTESTDNDNAAEFKLPEQFIIAGVSISDTRISYTNDIDNTRYDISGIDLRVAELQYGDPLAIQLSLNALSASPAIGADLSLAGTILYDINAGRYEISPLQLDAILHSAALPTGTTNLKLSSSAVLDSKRETFTLSALTLDALDTHLEASLNAADVFSSTVSLNGQIDLKGSDLPLIFRVLEQNELASRVESLDKRFAVSASLEADFAADVLKLTTVDASLLGANINGDIEIGAMSSDAPSFIGNLNASGPNLPTLIEVVGMLQGGSSSTLSQAGRDLVRVPDKSFRIQTTFNADSKAATLNIPELYISLLGTTITGNISADQLQSATLRANGKLNAQGTDLPLLLQIAGQMQGGTESPLNQLGKDLRLGIKNRAFSFTADFDADLGKGDISVPALSGNMLGLILNADIDAHNIQQSDGFASGSLSLISAAPKELLNALGQGDLAEVSERLELNLQLSGTGSNIRLSPLQLSAKLSGSKIPNSPQTLVLDADTLINLDTDSLSTQAFTLKGLGLQLAGSVNVEKLTTAPGYQGQLQIPAFNVRSLLAQLNQPLPPMTDPKTLRQLSLTTGFGGTANSFNLNNMVMQLDDSKITGSIALTDLSSLATQFTLAIDKINADNYMAPATTAPQSSAEPSPLPTATLREMNIQGKVNIGALTVNKLAMQNMTLEINAANGNIALAPFHADLYSGTFDADIRLDARTSTPMAAVTTTLGNINLEPLLQDYMSTNALTGKGNITFKLQGSGADTASIKRNLNGSGSINLEEGVLTGVDVSAVLKTVETMLRSRQLQSLPQGGETDFDNFSATLQINNGVVTSQDLSIKAPGWQIAGAGTLANLNQETINFNLLAAVDKSTATSQATSYDLGGYTLPIACTGKLDTPRCLPDAKQIIASAIGNVVQQRLSELFQNNNSSPQETGDPSDGTSVPATDAKPAEELLKGALERLLR